MYSLTLKQQKALYQLALFHIFVISASNYLVQIPFKFFTLDSTWGSLTFPFVFLATDLTIRIFGATLARKIIFMVMFPALLISYVISVLFFNGEWMGVSQLPIFNFFVFRIALASFFAYFIGQLLDITVFNYLRRNKRWWVAPSAAAIVGNAIDTLVFFFIAFYNSDDLFLATHWVQIGILDYSFKLIICGLFFLPLYGVLLNIILKKLLK